MKYIDILRAEEADLYLRWELGLNSGTISNNRIYFHASFVHLSTVLWAVDKPLTAKYYKDMMYRNMIEREREIQDAVQRLSGSNP